jgi:Zn-finger nucleic acid-binding protein
MKCPVCSETLTVSERQGVEIDFCPKCRGVWLDRGELDKILERAAAYQAPPVAVREPARDPRLRYDDDDHYKYQKRKKSIWHEIFD